MSIRNKKLLTLLGLFILVISIPLTVYLVKQRQIFKSRATVPNMIDLDVGYIERIPRYFKYCARYPDSLPQLCPGTENQKRWPDVGETITYNGHILNRGRSPSGQFNYNWLVNGAMVASGSATMLAAGQDLSVEYQTTWSSSHQTIQLVVDTNNTVPEISESNNSLAVGSHDLTISIWVEQGVYDIYNDTQNLVGSYSFEDWVQAQFAQMNRRLKESRYPVAPDGIIDQVKIDKIIVTEDLDGPSNPMNSDPNLYLIDGRWQFKDNDPTNQRGQGGEWQRMVDNDVLSINWGLIHELTHQLGVIDLYNMGTTNDPANNNQFLVTDLTGQVINYRDLPIVFRCPGIMTGGDTAPYCDPHYFENHTAGGMNSNYGLRRGFFGDYLFDTPTDNYLQVLDIAGSPLTQASVALYQRDAIYPNAFDNTPEISGITDSQGMLFLTNRSAPSITTATGHILRNNPFGQINLVGMNGIMFVKITKYNQESYHWLTITDLNLAYWSGQRDAATHTIRSNISSGIIDPVNQALNKPAIASRTSVGSHTPAKAIDGDKTTPDSSWEMYRPYIPGDFWQVDLGTTMNLGRIIIYPNIQNYGDWFDRFHIEVSNTGLFSGEQTTVITETNSPHTRNITYNFSITPGRYIRIVNDAQQGFVRLQEFEAYIAVTPTPTPTRTPTSTPTRTPTQTIPPPPPPTGEYGDNVLDIRDYNTFAFVSCFRKQVSEVSSCEAADLNDDGLVDSSDFTLLFESFQTQTGD